VELPLALKETALATADRDFLENYARSGLFVIKEPMEKSAKITEHQQVQREIADVCVPLDTKDLTVRLSCHAQLVWPESHAKMVEKHMVNLANANVAVLMDIQGNGAKSRFLHEG